MSGATAPVPRPRLSFNLGVNRGISAVFAEWPLPERLAVARSHGFEGVDGAQPEDPAAMREWLEAAGLRFACMTFARGAAGEVGLAALPDRRAEFRSLLQAALQAAEVLGCTLIHPLAGLVPDGVALHECRATYLANLRIACEEAGARGMQVAIEPLSARRQPRYLLHTYRQAFEWRDAVACDNLVLLLDMFHAAAAGESAAAIARKHPHAVGMFQVADAITRTEPAPADPELLGAIRCLAQAQWHGWISAEYEPSAATPDTLAWMAVLRENWPPLQA